MKKIIPNDMFSKLESDEETAFCWWCIDAKNKGFLNDFHLHNDLCKFNLSKKVNYETEEFLKTKIKKKEREFLKEHNYKCDFVLEVNPDLYIYNMFPFINNVGYKKKPPLPLFVHKNKEGKLLAFVDTKGVYAKNRGGQEFSINQKWIFSKYKIIINKIIIPHFFKSLWIPNKLDLIIGAKTKKRLFYTLKDFKRTPFKDFKTFIQKEKELKCIKNIL